MKQTVLDVLLYVFEHYMDDEADLSRDRESLRAELGQAGFRDHEVVSALEWLQGLACEREVVQPGEGPRCTAIRVYTAQEMDKLDLESRGFLLFLEQVGVLTHHSRELVVERILALEAEEMDLGRVKWVVFMVLSNQIDTQDGFLWMEDFVTDELRGGLH